MMNIIKAIWAEATVVQFSWMHFWAIWTVAYILQRVAEATGIWGIVSL